MKQLNAVQCHKHAHSTINCSDHTWAKSDITQTLYQGAGRVKSSITDLDICIHTYSLSG